MMKVIFALFKNFEEANRAINYLHFELLIPRHEISYVYKDKQGSEVTGGGGAIDTVTPTEGAISGATTGGIIGATIGLIGVAGLLGPLGPIVVAGPLATFLGITGGAGAIVGSGVAGAAIGGLVGALMSMGVSEPQARNYEERVDAGDILLTVHVENEHEVSEILRKFNATEITIVEEEDNQQNNDQRNQVLS